MQYFEDNTRNDWKAELLGLRKRLLKLERDQQENKRLIDFLRTRGWQHQMLVENAGDMLTLHRYDDLSLIFASPMTYAILGYNEEELRGMKIIELLDPDDVNHLMKIYRCSYENSEGRERVKFKCKNGSHLLMEVVWKVHRDEDGNKLVTLVSRDVSKEQRHSDELNARVLELQEDYDEIEALNRRLQEYQDIAVETNARLLESEERLDLALWASNECIWDWNLQNGNVYVNDSWANVLGYEWQEQEDNLEEWKNLFHPDDISVILDSLQGYFEGQESRLYNECRVKCGDGEWKWISISGKFIFRDKAGRTMRAVGLCQDITEKKKSEHQIESIQKEKQAILGAISELVVYEDLEHNILWCNQAAGAFGYGCGEIIGNKCYRVWFNREEPCEDCLVQKALQTNTFTQREIQNPEGRTFFHQAYPLQDEKGHFTGSVVIIRDVSEQREATRILKENEHRYRSLFERNPNGLFRFDMNGNILDANRYIVEILGAPDQEAFQNLSMLSSNKKEASLVRYELLQQVKEAQSKEGEIHFISSWGNEVWLQYKAEPIYNEQGQVVEGIVACEEISARKKSEEHIRFLSFNDPLTGLYNRAFFEEEMKRLDTQRQLPLSLIMADLNGLKLINDAFGHDKGDLILQKAADALRASCRREDIIARLGGDEFVVLLPKTSSDAAEEICNRIRSNCKKMEESSIQISLSLGMATRLSTVVSVNDTLKEAEDRMYRNKLIESRNIKSSFIVSLEKTLREKSHETEDHTLRLQKMVTVIGRTMAMSEAEVDHLNLLAALHDIGKIAIPSAILDKAGRLTPEEWDTMKKHPEIGYRIALSTPELVPIAEAILAHHEAWNGNGYPLSLAGDKIPLAARILAVADTFDVMVSGRPYRGAVTKQEALEEIQRCSGTQFDPEVVKVFIDWMKQ